MDLEFKSMNEVTDELAKRVLTEITYRHEILDNALITICDGKMYLVCEKELGTLLVDDDFNSFFVIFDELGNITQIKTDYEIYNYYYDGTYFEIEKSDIDNEDITTYVHKDIILGIPVIVFDNMNYEKGLGYREVFDVPGYRSLDIIINNIDLRKPNSISLFKPGLSNLTTGKYKQMDYLNFDNLFYHYRYFINNRYTYVSKMGYTYEQMKEMLEVKGYDTTKPYEQLRKLYDLSQEEKIKNIIKEYKKAPLRK